MNGEIDIAGIFVSTAVVTAAAALLVMIPLRRLFRVTGVMRVLWHPALVEVCLFALIWVGLTAAQRFALGWLP